MAEESTAESKEKKKPKSKFGMIMNSMTRSAKKGMSRAGQQMASGAAKYKHVAVEKIAKVPTTEEDPEILSSLERLKNTKTEIYSISDTARNLYETSAISTSFLYQLSEKLKDVKTMYENEQFATYSHKLSTNLCHLSAIKYQYLQNMEKELVIPLETFAGTDIDKLQKLKVKYKNCKTQYDIAAHKLTKTESSNSGDQSKINAAKEKKDIAYKELTALRNEIKTKVNNLEKNKNGDLLACIEKYWIGYMIYVKSQNDVITGNVSGLMETMNNIQSEFTENDNEMKNDIVETDKYNPYDEEVIAKQLLPESDVKEVKNEKQPDKLDAVNEENEGQEYNDEHENEIIDGYDPFDERFLPNSQNDI